MNPAPTNPSAKSLCGPRGVTADSDGNVYVADRDNNRVPIYFKPLTTDTTADKVLGQGNSLTSANCNSAGTIEGRSALSLCGPLDVATDSAKNAYVADGDNNRVLEYNTPVPGNTTADRVYGQGGSFTTGTCNKGGVSAKSLCLPSGVTVDKASPNKLYVADGQNNRQLRYTTPLVDATADGLLSQQLFTIRVANRVDNLGLDTGFNNGGIAIDKSNRVYVADIANNRVLAWSSISAFTTHLGANLVFGQPNFFTSAPNNGGVNANSLNLPEAVAVDSTGNLYVADTANNRVLEYNTPFANGTTADLVFGQANNFGTKVCRPISANSLCNPLGVAVDSLGNVYISDSNNNRVLEYNTPLTTDTVANRVVGQVNFVSGLANQGLATPTANGLTNPWGVALDSSDNLYVADNGNSRALEYNKPITNNEPASKVFGQGGVFNTGIANKGGLSATSLNFPQGIAVDKVNSVYIVDKSNNRTLKYLSPLATDVTADKVFGQNNLFDQGGCGFTPSPTSLCVPDGVAVDSAKNLYVVDGEDHRILQYLAP